jgi:predicted nucleic acid-binding protein
MDQAIDLMRHREFDVSSLQVLELAAASTCSAYDCEFVALAQDLGVPLVTVDRQILDQFPQIAVSLDSFVGL